MSPNNAYPHSSQIIVFAAIFSISAFNLLLRCFTFVMLSMYGQRTIAIAWAAEFALYVIVKMIMGDLRYWLAVYGVGEWFATFMGRLIVKIITDWTAVVQFRPPQDLGGIYWVITLLFTITSALVLSLEFSDKDEGYEGWDKNSIVHSVVGCSVGLLLSLLALLVSIKREYLETFLSSKTSNKACQEEFTKADTDELKMEVFTNHEGKWRNSIGSEVTMWIGESLPVWLEEEPEWFTDKVKSDIPDWAIKDKSLVVKLTTHGVVRKSDRRNSITDLIT